MNPLQTVIFSSLISLLLWTSAIAEEGIKITFTTDDHGMVTHVQFPDVEELKNTVFLSMNLASYALEPRLESSLCPKSISGRPLSQRFFTPNEELKERDLTIIAGKTLIPFGVGLHRIKSNVLTRVVTKGISTLINCEISHVSMIYSDIKTGELFYVTGDGSADAILKGEAPHVVLKRLEDYIKVSKDQKTPSTDIHYVRRFEYTGSESMDPKVMSSTVHKTLSTHVGTPFQLNPIKLAGSIAQTHHAKEGGEKVCDYFMVRDRDPMKDEYPALVRWKREYYSYGRDSAGKISQKKLEGNHLSEFFKEAHFHYWNTYKKKGFTQEQCSLLEETLKAHPPLHHKEAVICSQSVTKQMMSTGILVSDSDLNSANVLPSTLFQEKVDLPFSAGWRLGPLENLVQVMQKNYSKPNVE